MNPQDTLSQVEYADFLKLRQRVILAGGAGFLFAVMVAVMVNVLHIEPHPVVLFPLSFPIVIWLLIQMIKYKCPRCGNTPMITRLSFGGGEATAGGFVSLFPKKCSKCGVHFTAAHAQDVDTA